MSVLGIPHHTLSIALALIKMLSSHRRGWFLCVWGGVLSVCLYVLSVLSVRPSVCLSVYLCVYVCARARASGCVASVFHGSLIRL